MEALRQYNPNAICVYTGTRGQYGASVSLPVNEEAPTNPKGIYEISNLTAEKIIKVYVERRTEEEPFLDTFRRIGIDPFKERVYAANH